MIIKFIDFLNEKLNIENHKLTGYIENYKEYKFFKDDENIGYMQGLIENDIFWLNIILIEDEFRNQYLGEQFIIEYLKKYGGYIGSKSKMRSKYAEKMWERLIKRNDIIFELDYQKNRVVDDKYELVDKIETIYKISLK